jgi:hypothetical protein
MEIPLKCRYGLFFESPTMVERSRPDSSRDLLEELEDGWGAPPPPPAGALHTFMPKPAAKAAETPAENTAVPPAETAAEVIEEPDHVGGARGGRTALRTEESDGTSEPTDDAAQLPQSSPDLKALDEGWLDDLFPGGEGQEGHAEQEEDEDDEDEDEEPEPELPDERLDPEAFALAKKARDERVLRRKEKKRAKAEAKRARQKARTTATRQKQKAKKARPASPPRREPEPARKKSERPRAAQHADSSTNDDAETIDATPVKAPSNRPRANAASSPSERPAPSTLGSVKRLAIVLAILLAVAAAVAAIVK